MQETDQMRPAAWWSVLVEYEAPTTETEQVATEDERFDLLADAVEEHDGVIGGAGSSYSVRISVMAEDAAAAAIQGREIAWKAARHAGLPEWPCVRLEAVGQKALDEDLDAVALPVLVGAAEVSQALEVSRQRLAELRAAKPNFPKPVAELASGPVWLRPAIDTWVAGWDRKPGRPRNASAEPASSTSAARPPRVAVPRRTAPRGVLGARPTSGKSSAKSAWMVKTGRSASKPIGKRSPAPVGEDRGTRKGRKAK